MLVKSLFDDTNNKYYFDLVSLHMRAKNVCCFDLNKNKVLINKKYKKQFKNNNALIKNALRQIRIHKELVTNNCIIKAKDSYTKLMQSRANTIDGVIQL